MATTTIDRALPKKAVTAVHRAVEILRCLGKSDRPMGVNEIARALGIVPSTCLRILRSLDSEAMVSTDPATGRYLLGPMLLRLANDMTSTNAFVRRARPVLDELADCHRVTTAAVWLDGNGRVIVAAKASPSAGFGIEVQVGGRFPAFVTAIGLCVARRTGLSEPELLERFAQLKWQRPPTAEEWLRETRLAHEQGYAVDPGRYIAGVTVVAVPVEDALGRCSQVLVGVGVNAQLRGAGLESLIGDLRRASAALAPA